MKKLPDYFKLWYWFMNVMELLFNKKDFYENKNYFIFNI